MLIRIDFLFFLVQLGMIIDILVFISESELF